MGEGWPNPQINPPREMGGVHQFRFKKQNFIGGGQGVQHQPSTHQAQSLGTMAPILNSRQRHWDNPIKIIGDPVDQDQARGKASLGAKAPHVKAKRVINKGILNGFVNNVRGNNGRGNYTRVSPRLDANQSPGSPHMTKNGNQNWEDKHGGTQTAQWYWNSDHRRKWIPKQNQWDKRNRS